MLLYVTPYDPYIIFQHPYLVQNHRIVVGRHFLNGLNLRFLQNIINSKETTGIDSQQ